ncbi:MAG: threonine synthase [Chloroflexi bacterium]|nr:threonine synthase [Chloroflexota bacterium]|tara:strand:- start:250 stop:1428 length:1179 start_codon:yes stop_codon:yes gene_type:complete
MHSLITHLECTACGLAVKSEKLNKLCTACGKVLFARYDLEKAKNIIDRDKVYGRRSSMWRFNELMPIKSPENIVSLDEGNTPLLRASRLESLLEASQIWIKDESANPTGSFKARGLSAAVSKAHELGIKKLTLPSAGNAAGALAAYCAKAGIEAHVFMPNDAPQANRFEAELAGAKVTLVDGLISDAGVLAQKMAKELELFDVSTLKEPYRVEGKKTMGYEIASSLGWRVPEVIIYPTGGGTGIVGMWKAFDEMQSLGWIGSDRPKMVVVQSEGCAPIVRAYEQGKKFAEPWENASTIAAGIRVPSAIGDYLILDSVRKSGGTAITVSDQEIVENMKIFASFEGLWVAPEGAATLAAYKKLLLSGFLTKDSEVVLMNTGAGSKYLDMVESFV